MATDSIFILQKGNLSCGVQNATRGLRLRAMVKSAAAVPPLDTPPNREEVRLTLDGQGGLTCQRFASDGAIHELVPQSAGQQGVRLLLPAEELELFFSLTPWHETLDPRCQRITDMRHYVHIAFCGWLGSTWYDGLLYHATHETQRQESFCAEGGGVQLTVESGGSHGLESGGEATAADNLGQLSFNFRSSLVAAVRHGWGDLEGSGVGGLALDWGDEPDLVIALGVIVLRMAWPQLPFYLVDPPTGLPSWRYWRRFCQNLGVDFGCAHRRLVPAQRFELNWLRGLLPSAELPKLTAYFNRVTTVIPLELIPAFSDGVKTSK